MPGMNRMASSPAVAVPSTRRVYPLGSGGGNNSVAAGLVPRSLAAAPARLKERDTVAHVRLDRDRLDATVGGDRQEVCRGYPPATSARRSRSTGMLIPPP